MDITIAPSLDFLAGELLLTTFSDDNINFSHCYQLHITTLDVLTVTGILLYPDVVPEMTSVSSAGHQAPANDEHQMRMKPLQATYDAFSGASEGQDLSPALYYRSYSAQKSFEKLALPT